MLTRIQVCASAQFFRLISADDRTHFAGYDPTIMTEYKLNWENDKITWHVGGQERVSFERLPGGKFPSGPLREQLLILPVYGHPTMTALRPLHSTSFADRTMGDGTGFIVGRMA